MVYIILAIIAFAIIIYLNHSSKKNSIDTKSLTSNSKNDSSSQMAEFKRCKSEDDDPTYLYSFLSLEERINVMAVLVLMAEYANNDYSKEECTKMLVGSSMLMGLEPLETLTYCRKYKRNLRELLSAIKEIKYLNVKEMLVYNCWAFSQITRDSGALNAVYFIAEYLGYSEDEVKTIVDKVERLGNIF